MYIKHIQWTLRKLFQNDVDIFETKYNRIAQQLINKPKNHVFGYFHLVGISGGQLYRNGDNNYLEKITYTMRYYPLYRCGAEHVDLNITLYTVPITEV